MTWIQSSLWSDIGKSFIFFLLGVGVASYFAFALLRWQKKFEHLKIKYTSKTTVSELHRNKQGKISDKWSSYLAYYDFLFSPIKGAPINLFEIGVQNGGSLEVWGQYFENAEAITGCDIDEKCAALKFDDRRINVLVGDANSQEIYDKVGELGPFDIIIDDGSHRSDDILQSFLLYFPLLKPSGIYIVEDTHAVYVPPSPGLKSKSSALAFFKELTDLVNFQFWQTEATISELVSPFLDGKPIPQILSDGWVESLEFRNSIVTIRKSATADNNKVGIRQVVGSIATVAPEVKGLA
jgi:hypothetical protein